jgi:hypothetical protein
MSDDIPHGSNADARISRAETGDHGKRPAKVVLWIGIPFLIIGGIIFLTSGGITPALILGVVLALTGGALRDRAARSEGRAAPPEMQVPPMLTWPTSSSRPDLFRYRGADYSLGLVERGNRSRYVIQDANGASVGDYHYATDGWVSAWRAFRSLEPMTASHIEEG